MKPDLLQFKQHVSEAGFQTGVDSDMWGIVDEDPEYPNWPLVIIWVQAAPKDNHPDKYHFRFDLSGYPSQAPTACPWEVELQGRLPNEKWPKKEASLFLTLLIRHGIPMHFMRLATGLLWQDMRDGKLCFLSFGGSLLLRFKFTYIFYTVY